LVLVDKSPWVVGFLREYFRSASNVEVSLCSGSNLPFANTGWADVIFSQGMFITLKLGHAYLYLREFSRALKPGGVAIFDFIDPETAAGWEFLEREASRAPDIFAYHALSCVSRAAALAGLAPMQAVVIGKSTYMVLRKPE